MCVHTCVYIQREGKICIHRILEIKFLDFFSALRKAIFVSLLIFSDDVLTRYYHINHCDGWLAEIANSPFPSFVTRRRLRLQWRAPFEENFRHTANQKEHQETTAKSEHDKETMSFCPACQSSNGRLSSADSPLNLMWVSQDQLLPHVHAEMKTDNDTF